MNTERNGVVAGTELSAINRDALISPQREREAVGTYSGIEAFGAALKLAKTGLFAINRDALISPQREAVGTSSGIEAFGAALKR